MGFQLMQILGLLGMYYDAAVVEINKKILLFRLAKKIAKIQMILDIENFL